MDVIHEYGVFCEYTVHYVLYYVDVCTIYSVDPSLAQAFASIRRNSISLKYAATQLPHVACKTAGCSRFMQFETPAAVREHACTLGKSRDGTSGSLEY